MSVLLLLITLALMILGLAGTLMPLLPGIPLIYAGYVLFGLFTAWEYFGATTLVIFGLVTALSLVLDHYAGAVGTRQYGASSYGVWGSIVGSLAGLLVANLPGLIIGTFLGAWAGELWAGKSRGEALRAGKGALLGWLAGTMAKVALGVIMMGTFLWQVLA